MITARLPTIPLIVTITWKQKVKHPGYRTSRETISRRTTGIAIGINVTETTPLCGGFIAANCSDQKKAESTYNHKLHFGFHYPTLPSGMTKFF